MQKKKIKEMKPSQVEYWIKKKYSPEDAKFQVELHLMNTERAFLYKFGKEGHDLYIKQKIKTGKSNSNRTIDYWVQRGCSTNEAKLMVSNAQKKFSKQIVIDKFGENEGKNIINIRNDKWMTTLKSLSNYDEIQTRKDSKSYSFYKKKYGDNFIEEIINKSKNFNEDVKLLVIQSLLEKNYEYFIKIIKDNFDYDSKLIRNISNMKILQEIFTKSNNEIKEDIIKLYPILNKNSWGTVYSVDGCIVRSLGEKKIYEHLKFKNINFKYDKEYPFQNQTKYKYDFYLENMDVYIEYTGMENIRDTDKTRNIKEKYYTRLKIKREICVKNNLKHYFSKSVNDIIKFIDNLYE